MNVARWYRSSGKKSTRLLKLSRKIRLGCRRLETSWHKEITARGHCEEENLQISASWTDLGINDSLKALLKDKIEQAQALGKEAKDSYTVSVSVLKCFEGIASILCNGVLGHYAQPTLQQALQLKAEIDAAGCSKLWKRTFADSKLEGLSAFFWRQNQSSWGSELKEPKTQPFSNSSSYYQ